MLLWNLLISSAPLVILYNFTHWSKVVEPISPGDLVGQSRRVRMILVGVDLDVEGVGDDCFESDIWGQYCRPFLAVADGAYIYI